MSNFNKITILFLLVAVSLGYSLYHKKNLESYFEESINPVLEQIPTTLALTDFKDAQKIDLIEEAKNSKGLVVHFWGTWCAPCEYELPEFLSFSKKLGEKGVKVVLLAVNDDDIKIKKFMKRFGKLPDSIILVHDKLGASMKDFGVVKVPETFIFSPDSKSITKFSGPQDWKQKSYFDRVTRYLGIK